MHNMSICCTFRQLGGERCCSSGMSCGFLKEASTCRIEAAAHIRVEHPWTTIVTIRRRMDGLNRIHRAAPWPKAVGVGFKARLPFWLQGRLDDCLPHPVLSGRYAQGSLFPVVFWDVYPSDRPGLVPLQAQALLKQLPAGFRRVVHHSIDACRVFPLVFLGDTSDRQERGGRGSNKQFLKIFSPLPCLVRGGAIKTLLQSSYITLHRVPIDIGPCGVGLFFRPFSAWSHRLTSPKIRTLLEFSTVRTRRKFAPFQVGYPRVCGPIRPLTGRLSLFPSSHTLCSIPLPYGRDTTPVGNRGLTQLLMKKNVVRSSWSLYPGERVGCRHPQALEVILPTYPCGDGLSASLAMSLSRGFTMTLHVRSTWPAFPRPPPRRGWQRSEHCSQSFAPRMTRQHVWVGTPGHHRARSGTWSPSSILLHEPCEVQRMYVCSPPGRKRPEAGARDERALEAVACTR